MSDTLGVRPDPDRANPSPPPGAGVPPRESVLISEPPGMTEEELTAAWQSARQEAKNYNERLDAARAAALRLYNGEPFGDEEAGRSQIVLTEVKDTIAAMMPTVIRVFAGAERPVFFEPNGPGDEASADQATEYVHHVVFNECNGFRAIQDATADGLQLKAGWIRWHWDNDVTVMSENYTSLLEPQAAALITQDNVRALRVVRRVATEEEMIGLQGSPELALVQASQQLPPPGAPTPPGTPPLPGAVPPPATGLPFNVAPPPAPPPVAPPNLGPNGPGLPIGPSGPPGGAPPPGGMPPQGPIMLYDVTLTRRVTNNRPVIEAVPSEFVWIDPDASGPGKSRGVFISRPVLVSDLTAKGFDEEALLPFASDVAQQVKNRVTRKRDRLAASVTRTERAGPAMRSILYTEGWIRVDYDGDGYAELRRIQAVGSEGQQIIANEPASHVQLARIAPMPVPHKAIGEAVADRIGDLQLIGSRVMRNILDSMSESIHPRTVIVDGQVPVDDVLNTEMGAVIREKVGGAVRELNKEFIGPSALPILSVLQDIKETRTGMSKTSQGLTPEALQSTSPVAVSAQLAGSQDRLELVLRNIADGLRDLYAGVLQLMAEHQDRTRMVRLAGKWVPVDPRAWMSGFQVTVDVAVGRGTLSERVGILGMIAGKQEQIIQTYGPQNPLVTVGQYRATLGDMLAAAGIANGNRYFKDLPLAFSPAPPPPKPSPDELLAQVESQKTAASAKSDGDANAQKKTQMLLDDDRQRDQMRIDAMLKATELMAKYPGVKIDVGTLSQMADRDPELTMAMIQNGQQDQQAGPPGLPPPGSPPQAGPAAPSDSLANAKAFMPPALIQALAQMQKVAGPVAVPGAGPNGQTIQ